MDVINLLSAQDDYDEDFDGAADESSAKPTPSFWSLEYYQRFFDVDTDQVLKRMMYSVYPHPGHNMLTDCVRPNADLYGPFWISTTLVFSTAVAANIVDYFNDTSSTYEWSYDFGKVSLSAVVIYLYWWLIPTLLFAVLWWRKISHDVSYVELLCLYGYSLTVYIPVSLLWVIQWAWLQWLLGITAAVVSASVMLLTLWPALRYHGPKVAWGVSSSVVLVHFTLAAGFILYFFQYGVSSNPATSTTIQAITSTFSVGPTSTMQSGIPTT